MQKDGISETPIYSIISLLEVKLNRHESWLCLTGFEAVENFLDNDLVFRNPPIWYEGRLRWGDQFIQQQPKLLHQYLRNDFLDHVTEVDWSVMIDR